MSDVKWIKVTTNVFDNRKIKQLEAMPEGDSIIVIWFKILCLAGLVNDDGKVYITPEVPYTEQMLASQFNRPMTTIQLALNMLSKFEMIDIIDDVLHVSNWQKYQNVDSLEKIREQNRIRKQNQRAREKQKLLDVSRDISRDVTQQNKNKKEDIDKEKDKEKETIKKEMEVLLYFPEDEQLDSAFKDYVEMRKALKKPMTKKALELAINKLNALSGCDSQIAIAIVNQSIMNSWQGLFPLDRKTVPSSNSHEDYMERWRNL